MHHRYINLHKTIEGVGFTPNFQPFVRICVLFFFISLDSCVYALVFPAVPNSSSFMLPAPASPAPNHLIMSRQCPFEFSVF